MARIRSIHPDFPSDRKLAGVSRDARLTYASCWCIADDKGLFRAEPRQLLGQLYPYDTDVDGSHLEAWLSDLVELGVLRWRWSRDGMRVGEIVNWHKRQRIDRPTKSFLEGELLPLDADSRAARERLAPPSPQEPRALSLESRALSLEPGVGGADNDPLASVARFAELLACLPVSAHPALEGYVRAARDPAAVVASILAEGPDTGTNASAGKTWAHIGQALSDLRAAGESFRPVVFRAFVDRLVRDGSSKGADGALLTESEQMLRLAAAERERERSGAS